MASRTYTELPELPPRPHGFARLERRQEAVRLPGRAEPVELSWVGKGAGPPLLLVHGLMTSAYSWRYVIDALAERYRVIAVDLPGAGQSAAPTDLSQSPEAIAGLLDAFLGQLGVERAYVAGSSMGGYVCLWWWLLHPARFERLMVLNAPGFPEARLYALHALLSLPGSAWLLKQVTRHPEQFALDNVHYHDESVKSREETKEYARWLAFDERRALFRRHLLETMDPWTMRRLPAALAARKPGAAPVRLLWARHDVLVSPAFGPRYQALLPEAELVWLDHTSHFLQVDSPEATVREIFRFGG